MPRAKPPLTERQESAFHGAIRKPRKPPKRSVEELRLQDEAQRNHAVQRELKQAFLRRQAARTPPAPSATHPNAANGSLDG